MGYREGDWFRVDLDGGRYAVGRLTRLAHDALFAVVHLFGPYDSRVPLPGAVAEASPDAAAYVGLVETVPLDDNEWRVLDSAGLPSTTWPVPDFCSSNVRGWYRRTYDETGRDLHRSATPISREECARLPSSTVMTGGVVRRALDKLPTVPRLDG